MLGEPVLHEIIYYRYFHTRLRTLDHVGTYFVPILFLLVRSLQAFNVNLSHLKHSHHDAFRFLAILIAQHFAQSRGNDLPPQSEFVFQSAAFSFFPAGG